MFDKKTRLLIALEAFLGTGSDELARAYETSLQQVTDATEEFAAARSEILRQYFTQGENSEAVVAAFASQSPNPDHALLAARISAMEAELQRVTQLMRDGRMDQVERKLEAVEAAVTSASVRPTEAAPVTRHATPGLDLQPNGEVPNVQVASTQSDQAFNPRDHDRVRVHVTGQAIAQWRQAFGDGIHSETETFATDEAIKKRIVGIYFNGQIEGRGMVWTVTGVNRYSMSGVQLKCFYQGGRMYVSGVEALSLSEL